MVTSTLRSVVQMAKKRNDRSAKIDAEVLLMVETIVNWRKHTKAEDESLTVAEYISEMLRIGAAGEYEQAVRWHSQQLAKKPDPK